MPRSWLWAGLLLGLWLPAAVLWASGAAAHAVRVEAQPADGATLERPPEELRLRFNEPVAVVAVRLIDDGGASLPDLAVEALGEQIVVRPATPLPAGAYLLSYRVVSADGHPVGASLRFGVRTAVGPAAGEDVAEAGLVRLLGSVARLIFLAAALGAAGAALFVLLTRPPPDVTLDCARLSRAFAAVAVVAALGRLGLNGIELGGGSPADLAQSWPWSLALATSLGAATALALLALALLLLLEPARSRWRALAALLLVASFALTGHAATAPPRWLAAPALAVHVLAATFWVGSLLPLLLALRLERDGAVAVVQRFSGAATVAVPAVLLAGAILTAIQLDGDWRALWLSEWGQRLLVKLALVAGLLVIAAVNRLWLTPAVVAGRRLGCRLRTTLIIDLALVAGILGLTASFPLSPPPRAAPLPTSLVTTLEGAGLRAAVVMIPGRVGTNQIEVSLADAGGSAQDGQEVRLRLALPSAGIAPVTHELARVAPGLYLAPAAVIPLPGRWAMRLDVLVDPFTKAILEAEAELR